MIGAPGGMKLGTGAKSFRSDRGSFEPCPARLRGQESKDMFRAEAGPAVRTGGCTGQVAGVARTGTALNAHKTNLLQTWRGIVPLRRFEIQLAGASRFTGV